MGAKGGYTKGNYLMKKNQTIYIAVGGGAGTSWNGGGQNDAKATVASGGGATSIQKSLKSDGQLYQYESVRNSDVILVAGGGGGSEWYINSTDKTTPTGGSGGGTNGGDGATGYLNNNESSPGAKGGSQSAGGASTAIRGVSGTKSIINGSFGRGGHTIGGDGGGQGGGGWYGGGAADYAGGGGGGSGHIGSMITNGIMQSGIRQGEGKALITWHPALQKYQLKKALIICVFAYKSQYVLLCANDESSSL